MRIFRKARSPRVKNERHLLRVTDPASGANHLFSLPAAAARDFTAVARGIGFTAEPERLPRPRGRSR